MNTGDETFNARFEGLTGRFMEGLLSEAEDRELVELLNSNPAHATRFLKQMAMERLLIALADPERMSDGVFQQSVLRSIHLLNDRDGNERFARHVVSIVRGHRAGHSSTSVSRRRSAMRTQPLNPWAAVAAVAALVAVAVVLFAPDGSQAEKPIVNSPARLENQSSRETPVRVQPIDLAHVDLRDNNSAFETLEVAPVVNIEEPPMLEDVDAEALARAVPVADDTVKSPPQPAPARPQPAIALALPENTTFVELACVKPAQGCTAVLRRSGVAGGEMAVRRVELLGEGDLIRAGAPESSPSDAKLVMAGVEVLLRDGTSIWLKPNSTLRLQRVNGLLKPLLESGELLARVKPQPADAPLTFATAFGPEAKVLGTILRVQADLQARRVNLFVEEGKVQFSNRGESRLVQTDEASSAEDGKAPLAPYTFRPKPGALAGAVFDREKNQPVNNALVIASPLAQSSSTQSKTPLVQFKARTDAQGRYQFNELPEGPMFVYVVTEDGESRGIRGRGTVARTRVLSNEKANFNVLLDRAMLVEGRVTENGKALKDYSVRLVRQGGDGLTFNAARSGTIYWANGTENMDGFTFVALEGAGRYAAIVEKKGMIAKLRAGALNDLRPDRVTQWFIDASFTPSGVVKGRISGPGGATLGDDPAAQPSDPRAVRSIATLKGANIPVMTSIAEPDGTFTFDTNVESGTYDLRVERFGFQPDTRRVNVVAGKTIELTVTLKPAAPVRK